MQDSIEDRQGAVKPQALGHGLLFLARRDENVFLYMRRALGRWQGPRNDETTSLHFDAIRCRTKPSDRERYLDEGWWLLAGA